MRWMRPLLAARITSGLSFAPRARVTSKFPRRASLPIAARGKAGIVALTVDADDATLAEIVDEVAPDFLQLHGNETPERVAEIKQRFGRPDHQSHSRSRRSADVGTRARIRERGGSHSFRCEGSCGSDPARWPRADIRLDDPGERVRADAVHAVGWAQSRQRRGGDRG